MRSGAVTVDLSGRAHTGMVIMRPDGGHERGLLLLNVAETQARIRHLPGFLSASFLSDRGGAVLVEFLQWRSSDDVEAAFRQPAFHEHLPVVTAMAPHPVIAFGAPAAVLTANGEPRFALDLKRYSATVLQVENPGFDVALKRVANWARALVGTAASAAVVVGDPSSSHIAALLAGRFAEIPAPDFTEHGIRIVEHVGALELYASIGTPADGEQPLRYVMTDDG